MVPRRPNRRLRGSVSQQPRTAQHSCARESTGTHQKRGRNAYIWCRVDQAEEPLILTPVALAGVDAKLLRKEKIRAVDDGFVHLIR